MTIKTISMSILLGFALVIILVVGVSAAANMRNSQEVDLTPDGYVYEVNPDSQGSFWISEFHANQVWQINPATGVYTIFHELKNASDARMDANGDVWWSNFGGHTLGQLDPEASTVTSWTLPSGVFPLGIAFDDSNLVWVTDYFNPTIYSFDGSQICSYQYDGSGSAYLIFDNDNLWFGDFNDGQIVQYDSDDDQFIYWSLQTGSKPYGIVADRDKHIWWADQSGYIGMLDPEINTVTVYTTPIETKPQMISISDTAVWYTEFISGTSLVTGTVGSLYPSAATNYTYTVTPTYDTVSADCNTVTSVNASVIPTTTGTLSWSPNTYTNTVSTGGWQIYQLPSSSKPQGIATIDNDIYFTDNGRQKLGWLKSYSFYFPMVYR